MALYELVVRQELVGQSVINRFHYQMTGTPASVSGSFALTYAAGFIADGEPPVFPADSLFGLMRELQSNSLSYLETQAANLYSDPDFYTNPFPIPVVGGVVEACASPALSYGLTSSRVTRAIRRGQKRIAGVTEGALGSGGIISGGYDEVLAELAAKMSDNLTYDDEGTTLTFNPVVLSFEEYETPAGNRAYRPYATQEEQEAHMAVGVLWTPKTYVRTQTSRQYGRGS